MNLSQRPPIKIIIETFRKYRRKEIDAQGLEQGISSAASLLENDIPTQIREAIERANSQTDDVRFLTGKADQPHKVLAMWRELEDVLSRHGVQLDPDEDD